MTNTKNILILAAVGIGAYLLLTKTAGAATVRPGAPMPGTRYPAGTVPGQVGTPQQQLDALNNGTLYGVGRFINGLFSGGGSAAAPSGGGYTTGQGTREILNDDIPGQAGYGWSYYTDGTSIGPDGTYYRDGVSIWTPPDAYAANPPGGYEQSTAALYSNDMYGEWN